ncbi:hypothetical protein [Amycolatopsis nalaikhensis]|uniref:ATP-grasp domain-containing protein n=1 Tax=Amycolatopsis nalaikhensis TaxID=715472 RepID=A0ABY8XCP7_9PSEU|nr:hypothetical protein [Amycolatopsis sp. 2-2]WIV52905.1 hypothetical protein QP939_28590 [Amycolatopsis sp. 2-2]
MAVELAEQVTDNAVRALRPGRRSGFGRHGAIVSALLHVLLQQRCFGELAGGEHMAPDLALGACPQAASGLTVPRTVITNAPEHAAEHSTYLGPSAVYKALASATVADGNRVAFIPTTEVTTAEMADGRVALTAHQFQARVPKVRDVRATVVGNRVFAATILPPEDGTIDWRANYAALHYEPVTLPNTVEAALLSLLDRLGLAFAAADFVVTADGQHHFVDLNPSGQWGWIQEATGLPIAAALAAYLTGEAP